jgi:hypothetical protein
MLRGKDFSWSRAIGHFAAKAHLEALLAAGRPIPPAFRDKFVLTA